jgi:hypothetical protein
MGHEDLRDAGLPECRMPTSIEEDIAVGIDNYEGSWEGFGSASWDDFFDALK